MANFGVKMAHSRLKMAHSRLGKRPGRGQKDQEDARKRPGKGQEEARKRPEKEIWPKPAPGQRGDPYPKTALED